MVIAPGLTLTGGLNFSNGPFANKKAVIGKLGIRYDSPQFFFQRIGFELSDLVYKENRDDTRGFAATLSLTRYLFND